MLTEVEISNFRGFENHTVPLRTLTVAVGLNNAGKSTLVEGLRIISIVAERHKELSYVRAPAWANVAKRYPLGERPSV